MCEPTHSVVQYPATQAAMGDTNHDVMRLLNAVSGRNRMSSGQKIGDYMHYHKAGFGHSETISKLTEAERLLPTETRYEGEWWNRDFKVDGPYNVPEFDKQMAYDMAAEYSRRHCTANTKILAKFLADSLRRSDQPEQYLERFLHMIKPSRRAVTWDEIKVHLQGSKPGTRVKMDKTFIKSPKCDALIAQVMQLANTRDILVPEWADDDTIWTPDGQPVTV